MSTSVVVYKDKDRCLLFVWLIINGSPLLVLLSLRAHFLIASLIPTGALVVSLSDQPSQVFHRPADGHQTRLSLIARHAGMFECIHAGMNEVIADCVP